MTKLTIPLDADTARIYSKASAEEQKKLRVLLSLLLREFAQTPTSLRASMDEISKKAKARGLTPDILDSLLNA